MTRRSRLRTDLAAALAVTFLASSVALYRGNAALAEAAPGDVVLKRAGTDSPEGRPTAVFPHWRHRLFFTCNVCHPAIFPMKGGETTISMDDFQEGKSCGVCHNGKIAWGVSISTCARCHTQQ